jgi:hypothetical protein
MTVTPNASPTWRVAGGGRQRTGTMSQRNRFSRVLAPLLVCVALVNVRGDGTERWLRYRWGPITFKYPSKWIVKPQLYRTPPQEAAGAPPELIGLVVHPRGESERGRRSISIGGRQASCESFVPSCQCFTIYEAIYTCADDGETLQTFDLLLKSIRYNNPKAAFQVVFPAAQDSLRPNTSYTIRWNTRAGLRIRRVDVSIRDTSKPLTPTVLYTKAVPNTGRYEWQTPMADSEGPFIIEISFVKPMKATPPAMASGRIYAGYSNPFYIR